MPTARDNAEAPGQTARRMRAARARPRGRIRCCRARRVRRRSGRARRDRGRSPGDSTAVLSGPMPIVESATAISAARDKLFALAQDYALRLRWDPFLREIRFLEGAERAAVGVRVWVKARNGLTMEVRYVTFREP